MSSYMYVYVVNINSSNHQKPSSQSLTGGYNQLWLRQP